MTTEMKKQIILEHEKELNEEQKSIFRILLAPIVCTSKCEKEIFKRNEIIYSSQSYVAKNGMKNLDEDMSDFTIKFYEIIYKNLLGNNSGLLLPNGEIRSVFFAGDTMNSFGNIASVVCKDRMNIPKKDWPNDLLEYEKEYHCLANFWLLPLELGRTGVNLSKAKTSKDYMDRFLRVYNSRQQEYSENYKEYFSYFKNGFEDFTNVHFLKDCYVDKEYQVDEFSQPINGGKEFRQKAWIKITKRAVEIAKSEFQNELFVYFNECGVI